MIVTIPTSATVLVVEDSIARRHWFLNRVPQAFLATSVEQANQIIERFIPDMIFLDYDLALGTSSESVANFLATKCYGGAVYIHSSNPFGMEVLRRILPQARVVPWGEFEIVRGSHLLREFRKRDAKSAGRY